MGIVSISCNLHLHITDINTHDCEQIYRKSLKKIITFLYNHPKIFFSFYFAGPFLDWISKYHSEFIDLLSELVNRKQVEVLGGGYYEPIFPLIMPIDRVGQIELNTTNIRKQIGKKPRGIFLGDSVWDPALISCFKTCGMEYAILDTSIIPQNGIDGKTYIAEDMGKTITVIPMQPLSFQQENNNSPSELIKKISRFGFADEKDTSNKLYFTSLSVDECIQLIDNKWLTEFCSLVETSVSVEFTTPSIYLKNNQNSSIRTLIPTSCTQNIQKWSIKPFTSSSNELLRTKNANIRSFLYTYQEIQYLYSRMMYSGLIVTQCKGDKSRKKTARESLWKAQVRDAYWYLGDSGICSSEIRQNAYKHLISSEKYVRETTSSINDCALSFDYDMDGRKEYVIHQNDYNAFISLSGGMIFELDLLSNTKNYCDTMRRIFSFDGITDAYQKKLFLDHLIEYDNFDKFTEDASNSNAVFTQVVYTEHSFDRIRKELQLNATALFGVLQQKVSLKKKFAFSQNGIQVQYIIKNESPLPLQCYFAVESNLCLSGTSNTQQLIEIISDQSKEESCPDQVYIRQDGVSLAQFTDVQSKNVFVFEPNEDAGICIQPLYLSRPISKIVEKRYQATTNCFFWKISIPPAYELEKTLFLGICPSKKTTTPKRKKTN